MSTKKHTKRRNHSDDACYACGMADEKRLNLCKACGTYVCDDCAKDELVFPCKCGMDDLVEAVIRGCTTFVYGEAL